MKYLLILLVCFNISGCIVTTSNDNYNDQYYDGYQQTTYETIVKGNITFYLTKTYYQGYQTVSVNVYNNSSYYTYSFDFQLQVFNNGSFLTSSYITTIDFLSPKTSQSNVTSVSYNTYYTSGITTNIVINNIVSSSNI